MGCPSATNSRSGTSHRYAPRCPVQLQQWMPLQRLPEREATRGQQTSLGLGGHPCLRSTEPNPTVEHSSAGGGASPSLAATLASAKWDSLKLSNLIRASVTASAHTLPDRVFLGQPRSAPILVLEKPSRTLIVAPTYPYRKEM
jgi:hypothetical protein